MNSKDLYPIKIVERKTGLSHHVIRIWEKRYNVISPVRTEANHRLYSDDDIELLCILKRLTENGFHIGQISRLPRKKLLELQEKEKHVTVSDDANERYGIKDSPDFYLKTCMEKIRSLETGKLLDCLSRASISLSKPVLLEQVITPLLHEIGEEWQEGKLRVLHEHFSSSVIRTFLDGIRARGEYTSSSNKIVIATPAGQLHEFGSLLAAIVSASEGWEVIYLGPSLPAEEIIETVIKTGAKVLSLSIVYNAEYFSMSQEIKKLGMYIPQDRRIIYGGRAAENVRDIIEETGGEIILKWQEFRKELERIRN